MAKHKRNKGGQGALKLKRTSEPNDRLKTRERCVFESWDQFWPVI